MCFCSLTDWYGSETAEQCVKARKLRKIPLHNSMLVANMQRGCKCGEREEVDVGSGVVLQSGTLAVWNAGRGQSRWEPSTAVCETISSTPLTLPSSSLLSRLQAQKRGAILHDQNEAGTDYLV